MREYDDERYQQWVHEINALVFEFLDTDGNTEESLRVELDSAIENAQEDEDE
jgi:hypothetical protein